MLNIDNLAILIADDMDTMRRSIRGMLKVMGIGTRIEYAANGKEAWAILSEKEVDLAIIDWNMPEMNGQEVLTCIRSHNELRDMPVIMITAESAKEIITEVAESDIDAYLLKPLTIKALEHKIKSIVKLINDPSPYTKYLKVARALEEKGDIPAAIEETKKALKENPSSSKVIRKLGLLYGKMNKDDIQEKCLTKAAAINKDDMVTRNHLIDFYLKKENVKSAIKYYEEALSINPRLSEKGLAIGQILLKKRMVDPAEKVFNFMLKHSPQKNKIREKVANMYMENGLNQFARKLFELIAKDHPERDDIALKIGSLYEKEGNTDGALTFYSKADDVVNDNVDAKLKIAKIYLAKGKVFLADEYLNKVLKIDPNNEEALSMRKENI